MISKFFIHRPKFAFVISILFCIAGYIAIEVLPIAQYPDIVPPMVTITANYPGANAETVEKTIVIPLESQVNGVKNMIYMSSQSSNDGSATINVSFNIGTDPDMNTVNTQNRVSIAQPQLPEEVVQQGITVKQKSTQMLLIMNVISPTNKHDQIFLSNYASLNLRDEMIRIPGVGDAQILGAQDYSMRIWLDPETMTSLKISTEEVINSIKEQNIQVAAGQVGAAPTDPNQQFKYTIQTKGRLSTVHEFEEIIIRANNDGSTVTIKDIARVQLGAATYSSFGQLNGKPCANLAIYQLPGANALEVANACKAKLKELKKKFDKDIDCVVLHDTTEFVEASIHEVVKTLFIAVILVILVVFIFLQDWRSVLIPTIAIPVSLIGTFAFMLAFGYTINTVSLFGLILAIGIVVDDAIIVVENVNRIMEEEGLDSVAATEKSMVQVTGPVIATTLVLMAVFVPVAFLPGITGELYRQFAVTISISVIISSINALTLSPALCASLLKHGHKNKFILFVWFDKFFNWLTKRYNNYVSITVRKLTFVTTLFLFMLVTIYYIYGSIPTGFVPSEDQGTFMVNIQLPNGSSLNRTTDVINKVEGILNNIDGVANVITVSGFSMLSNTSSSNMGLAIAVLKNWSERTDPKLFATSLIRKANREFQKIPNANIFAFDLPPISGLGTSGGFEFILQDRTGGDPQRLAKVLKMVIDKANQNPAISAAFSTYEANVPQIFLNIDRKKAKKLGIPLSSIFNTLQTFLGSIYVNDFNKFGKIYKVYLQAETQFRSKAEDINNLYTKNSDGDMVPLKTLLTTKIVFGPQVIEHYNMFTSATINGDTAPGYSSGQAIKTMEQISNEILPEGMTYSWTGTAYQEIIAGNMVTIIFLLAIVFIYLFLVAQYESWMISIAVMLSIPVAFLGAILALKAFGIANNIYAQIGFVLLFGLASKTAILIVEFAKVQHEKEGKSILEAAKFSANIRFRAVMMTAIAALLGFLPLVIATGAGANSRISLGTSVMGGMLFATVFGTLFVPSFYALIQTIVEFKWNKKNNKDN